MNRNANSRFALAPSVNIPRTKMQRPFNNSLTFDVGMLVPFYYNEVLPGSTHRVKTHKVIRTQPLVSAPMQELYADTYYFYVPWRLVWSHFKNFMGENTDSPWVPNVEYTIPQLTLEPTPQQMDAHILKNSFMDYLGLPMHNIKPGGKIEVSALYARAYALIIQQFFQSEAVETPLNVPLDDTNRPMISSISSSSDINNEQNIHRGGMVYTVNKFHDYFTSVLPRPIKSNNDVLALPDIPVLATNEVYSIDFIKDTLGTNTVPGLKIGVNGASIPSPTVTGALSIGNQIGSSTQYNTLYNIPSEADIVFPKNLKAFNTTTIEDLRMAFAVERLLNRDAIGGTRYREVLRAHFGVISPDMSQQVPLYLGGYRKMLDISQVVQTSETGETPLGNIAGMSLTSDSHYDFESSFTEHGLIMGLMCVRYKHRYSQGIRRCLSRKTRLDFYFPEFAYLDSQSVLKKEIYADGSDDDNDVFGYSEYAADYRFNPDIVCAEMRPDINSGLASWSFADNYNTHPTLSRNWLKEDKTNFDRALAVSSNVANQIWANIQVDEIVTLPMPLYSIPPLMSSF